MSCWTRTASPWPTSMEVMVIWAWRVKGKSKKRRRLEKRVFIVYSMKVHTVMAVSECFVKSQTL